MYKELPDPTPTPTSNHQAGCPCKMYKELLSSEGGGAPAVLHYQMSRLGLGLGLGLGIGIGVGIGIGIGRAAVLHYQMSRAHP